MIIGNKKNQVVTIIDGGAMDESSEGLNVAAEDIMHCLESKDVEGFKSALQAFVELCEEVEGDEGEKMSNGGIAGEMGEWSEGEVDGPWPETAQERQARYMGERY